MNTKRICAAMRRVVLPAALAGALLVTGCAGSGVAQTRHAAPAGHAQLGALVVLVDTDHIGGAFAAYKGSLPFGSTSADWSGFIGHFTEALRAEARNAGVEARVEALSLKDNRQEVQRLFRGDPVLTLRSTQYTTRKTVVGGTDLGWAGDTTWAFTLSERPPGGKYATSWSASVRYVNLNPALCGNYERCSAALAQQVFQQLRENGLVR